MSAKIKRFIVVGLDGMQLPMARRFADEGAAPNFHKLLERGACGELLPCLPSWTPTNWGTIATGAYPGSTGLAGWFRRAYDDLEGENDHSTFASDACDAETIWEAAERQGVRSLSVFHPISWPPRVKESMVAAPLYSGPGVKKMTIAPGVVWRTSKNGDEMTRLIKSRQEGDRYVAELAGGPDAANGAVYAVFCPADAKAVLEYPKGTAVAEATCDAWSAPVWLDFGDRGKGGVLFRLVRLDPDAGEFVPTCVTRIWRLAVVVRPCEASRLQAARV